jgi:hypothetical protein
MQRITLLEESKSKCAQSVGKSRRVQKKTLGQRKRRIDSPHPLGEIEAIEGKNTRLKNYHEVHLADPQKQIGEKQTIRVQKTRILAQRNGQKRQVERWRRGEK